MPLNCGDGENSWESLGLQGAQTSPSYRESVLNIHWKDWCWSWSSNNLATWSEELTHWERPWCWERLKVGGGEGASRGWDGWMASRTPRTWVWVNSRSSWCTGRPGVLQSTRSQRIRQDWATELNWTAPTNQFSFTPFPGSWSTFTPLNGLSRDLISSSSIPSSLSRSLFPPSW